MCHGWGSVVIHHAHPQSARHGLAWYELDPNWYGIFALRMLGLAWDIKLPRFRETEERKPVSVGFRAYG